MKQNFLIAGFIGLGLFTSTALSAAELPVRHVTITSNGLVHLEHQGTVDGRDTVTLGIATEDVDDILKSLLVSDPQGANTQVSVPGKQPLIQKFKGLPLDPHDLGNLPALLGKLQGHAVSVHGPQGKFKGAILNVAPHIIHSDKGETRTTHILSVMTEDGIRQATLEACETIAFQDPALSDAVKTALEAFKENGSAGKKTVTIALNGEKERPVSVSYIMRAPVWKTSYRLQIPTEKQSSGTLQGWGVLENMTTQDWENIGLTLISGAAVSYTQPLYESYYVDRPELPVTFYGPIQPRRDGGTIVTGDAASFELGATMDHSGMGSAPRAAKAMRSENLINKIDRFGSSTAEAAFTSNMGAQVTLSDPSEAAHLRFDFKQPVSVKAGNTLMLPIINQSMQMEKVWVYQMDTNPNHPLLSVQIKNTLESAIPPGILTVFSGGDYVGDAELPFIGSGEDRFVSFALDTKTTISREQERTNSAVSLIRHEGVLKLKSRLLQNTIYKIKAPANEDRVIVIEHPKQHDWVFEGAQKPEETATHYRIRVKLKAGEERQVPVTMARDQVELLHIESLDISRINVILAGKIDDSARAVFQKIAAYRTEIDKIRREAQLAETKKREIHTDQQRIRENLRTVGNSSDMGRRYTEQLREQEEMLERLNATISKARDQEQAILKQAYDYLKTVAL